MINIHDKYCEFVMPQIIELCYLVSTLGYANYCFHTLHKSFRKFGHKMKLLVNLLNTFFENEWHD